MRNVMGWIWRAVAAFVGTNLDDILVLTVFFAQANGRREQRTIVLGQMAGIGILTVVGILGGQSLRNLPGIWLRLMGLLPMAMGVRAWLRRKDEEERQQAGLRWWQVMLVTLANGGDNIGVYIPVFAGFTFWQTAGSVVIFAGMTAVWCLLGMRAGSMGAIRGWMEKYRHVAVPILLVGLGIMIMLG